MVHSSFIYLDISDTYYIRYISYLHIFYISEVFHFHFERYSYRYRIMVELFLFPFKF